MAPVEAGFGKTFSWLLVVWKTPENLMEFTALLEPRLVTCKLTMTSHSFLPLLC